MAKRFLPTMCFKVPSSITLPRRNSRKDDGGPASPSPTAAAAEAAAATSSSSSCVSTREQQLRRVFQRIDTNGDGRISPEEFLAVLSCSRDDEEVGTLSTLQEEAAAAVAVLGDMGYDEFVRLMEEGSAGDNDGDIQHAFRAFETEKGSGCITPDGLRRALHRLGEAWWTPEDCARMIHAYDADGNGVIDYHEFRTMMTTAV